MRRFIGLDLSRTLSDEEFAAIESVLHDRALLVVRDQQNTTPEQHIAFSRRFGDLEVHVQGRFLLPGYPEIYRISNCVDAAGKPLGLAEAGRVWHTDLSYMAEPSWCSLLHALEVPHDDAGEPLGATVFANARLAYSALPDSTKDRIKDLKAVHRYGYIYDRINAVSKPGRQDLNRYPTHRSTGSRRARTRSSSPIPLPALRSCSLMTARPRRSSISRKRKAIRYWKNFAST